MSQIKKVFTILVFVPLIFGGSFAISTFRNNTHLTVTFLNVGQGDSVLIETPSGQVVLIDCGPDRSVLAELGRSLPSTERTIDLLILTHPDADHITGCIEVIRRYHVPRVLLTGITASSDVWMTLEETINTQQIPFTTAQAGQTFVFGQTTLSVLFPFEDVSGQMFESTNDSSIVAKLTFGSESFLFTGDAPIEVEERLIDSGSAVHVDVLKVGHHGSASSSSAEFLDAVSPGIAVIQVGEGNRYGHPTQEVLERLKRVGATILRTDKDGRVEVKSNGKKVWVE